jgi:hypothetical protein
MKQVIVLEKHDLARLKDGETLQLTPTLLLSVERAARKATPELTPTPPPPAKPPRNRKAHREAHRMTLESDGHYHCQICRYTTDSMPKMRGHLGAHAKARLRKGNK